MTPDQYRREGFQAGVYIASKAKYAREWLAMRDNGYPIISTWIDEADEGEPGDWPDLWSRCVSEASSAKSLVVICRDGDTLKGAWVEVGAALGAGKTVFAAGCHSFTIRHHPRFVVCTSEAEAFARADLVQKGGE